MFRENLRRILEERNISQNKFAKMIGASKNTTIGSWLNGYVEPSLYYVLEICKVLQITPNDLLGYSEYSLSDYSTDELLLELKRRTRM